MKGPNKKKRSRTVAITAVLPLLALAACTQQGSSNSPTASQIPATETYGTRSDSPKVPFENQPCQTFSAGEMKQLGFAVSKPAKPGRDPDRLAFDNTCDFDNLTIEYTSQSSYTYQQDHLRKSGHHPPGDLPNAFYDVLGNLWFAEKGYYVVIPNTVSDADKEKVAHAIATKL